MHRLKRQELILSLLKEKGFVSSQEINASLPDASIMTINRDIKDLAEVNLLEKVWGGVKQVKSKKNNDNTHNHLDKLSGNNLEQAAKKIAIKIKNKIKNNESIYIGNGEIMEMVVRDLLDKTINIITPSLRIASITSCSNSVKTFIIGGQINSNSMTTIGHTARDSINNYQFNKVFITCSGIDHKGFYTNSRDEWEINLAALEKTKETYLIVDNSKFNKQDLFFLGNYDQIDRLVVEDKKAPFLEKFVQKTNFLY